jgi:hypothetical protein
MAWNFGRLGFKVERKKGMALRVGEEYLIFDLRFLELGEILEGCGNK